MKKTLFLALIFGSLISSSTLFAKDNNLEVTLSSNDYDLINSKLSLIEIKNKTEYDLDTSKRDLKTKDIEVEFIVKKKKAEVKFKNSAVTPSIKGECEIVNRQYINAIIASSQMLTKLDPLLCKSATLATNPSAMIKKTIVDLKLNANDFQFVKTTEITSNVYRISLNSDEYELLLIKKESEKKTKYKVEVEINEADDQDVLKDSLIKFLTEMGVKI